MAGGTGRRLYSFVILTVAAAPSVRFIHERMPAILSLAEVDAWLNQATPGTLALAVPNECQFFRQWLTSVSHLCLHVWPEQSRKRWRCCAHTNTSWTITPSLIW